MADIYRNINIIREFNASSQTEIFDIYQPGLISPTDIINSFRYSGFLTSLRLTVDITSIPEVRTIPVDIMAGDDEQAQANQETFNGNAKKCLRLYIRNSITPMVKVADAFLFNQRPYYYLSLINFFTDVGTFDVGNDTVISCGFTDIGNGLLMNEDRVLLLGTVIEKAPTTEGYLEVYQ
ncbi:hypothetical protein [Anabaena azotica]|uniref:Uncharacterized protein n=1 Tax=Anabaena azotica FACHB-119 TaxID=947527 RepID=A0ABR8DCH9_9NOST|nr:hypothetical protein [Anabaena azotica]MBD2503423.1 hypothetical protein [Anabaena azotica FACHB-119]